MARVVAVHGILHTFDTRMQMKAAWEPALLGGVQLAAGRRDVLAADEINYVSYGDVFRPPGRFLSNTLPPLTAEDIEDGPELELLLAWWAAAARVDPRVVPPDSLTLGTRSSARAAVLALSGSKWLARVSERALLWLVKQVTVYFIDPDIRRRVQSRFGEGIGGDSRVVVAHSLGSVVAYEALCAHPEWGITDLVTLGSPLGIPHIVLHRLQPLPTILGRDAIGMWPHVQRWVNISDDGDFVALQPLLREVFGDQVTDIAIHNGVGAHDVTRYLSAVETGAAILAGLYY